MFRIGDINITTIRGATNTDELRGALERGRNANDYLNSNSFADIVIDRVIAHLKQIRGEDPTGPHLDSGH